MKKILYTFLLLLTGSLFSTARAQGTQVFNDTILFQINRIDLTGNGFRYLLEFQVEDNTSTQALSGGIGVLSMCNCYCDSLWEAWPAPSDDSIMTGGIATLSYMSAGGNSGNPGLFGQGGPVRQRGRINILQMPGSFLRNKPFTLPIIFKAN